MRPIFANILDLVIPCLLKGLNTWPIIYDVVCLTHNSTRLTFVWSRMIDPCFSNWKLIFSIMDFLKITFSFMLHVETIRTLLQMKNRIYLPHSFWEGLVEHGKFQLISSSGQAVQYKYRRYEASRDGTPSEWSPSSETMWKGTFVNRTWISVKKRPLEITVKVPLWRGMFE